MTTLSGVLRSIKEDLVVSAYNEGIEVDIEIISNAGGCEIIKVDSPHSENRMGVIYDAEDSWGHLRFYMGWKDNDVISNCVDGMPIPKLTSYLISLMKLLYHKEG